jgi:hypothetical protein
MNLDMSIEEMVDTFIYVIADRSVIDWRERDWERVRWLPRTYVAPSVYKLSALTKFYRKAVIEQWLKHSERKVVATLQEAVELAAQLRRHNLWTDGVVFIDIAAIERNAKIAARLKNSPDWIKNIHAAEEARRALAAAMASPASR